MVSAPLSADHAFISVPSIPLVCVFLLCQCCFVYSRFVVNFEVGKYDSFIFVLLFQDWGCLQFHLNFRLILSISVKKAIEILLGIALNL